MKQVHANYTFVASTKTITLTGLNIAQDQLLLITNATRGVIYYNFASSSHRAVVTAGADTTVVLTDASTTGHADSDQLTIYYDDQVSGSSVTISNFPATQTIAGTVTANLSAQFQDVETSLYAVRSAIAYDDDGDLKEVSNSYPLPVVVNAGSVTIGSLPAISGTVTANVGPQQLRELVREETIVCPANGEPFTIPSNIGSGALMAAFWYLPRNYQIETGIVVGGTTWVQTTGVVTLSIPFTQTTVTNTNNQLVLFRNPGGGLRLANATTGGSGAGTFRLWALSDGYYGVDRTISGTVTARLQDGSGNNLTSTSIGGLQRLNVSLASAATPGGALPSFVNVYGGTDGSAVRTISVDSTGRQNTNVQLPRVTFIDGSGSVTTANSAITVFASSTTRSYLLVQVTTGSAFVNVGATATTLNGISLTAGQGYAWETTIPQGIVSLISTTTSSRWVAKES